MMLATRIERYVNEEFVKHGGEIYIFTYAMIASELGLDFETVQDILYGVDGGHTGIRVMKG